LIKQTDTTSRFALPSEFKSKWESFVKESLIDAFCDLLPYPLLFAKTINALMSASYEQFENSYDKILQSLLDVLK